MSNKKTLSEAATFAFNELKAANIRNARIDTAPSSTVYLTVQRSFAVEGSINVSFAFTPKGKSMTLKPNVSVNFPACNKDIVRAAAFMHIVNELVPLAASLQAQLDEFEITTD